MSLHELTAIRDNLLAQLEAINALINASDEKALYVHDEEYGKLAVLQVEEVDQETQLEVAREWYGDDLAQGELDVSEIVRVRVPDTDIKVDGEVFVREGNGVWTFARRDDLFAAID
jgi:hypothetical protein